MALPLYMLYGLQLRRSQKVVLAGIFSLGSLVAIVDILRTVESLESGTFSGVALWSSLEVTIAVIVASLPLYRALLTSKGRNSLLSRLSGSGGSGSHNHHHRRYKGSDASSSPAGTERKFLEANTSLPGGKPSVSTFRDDLETQEMEFAKYAGAGQRVPLVHLPR